MSELKILSHLGTHPNVLNLLGAITTNLSLGKIYLMSPADQTFIS